jgi:hypothetical protein
LLADILRRWFSSKPPSWTFFVPEPCPKLMFLVRWVCSYSSLGSNNGIVPLRLGDGVWAQGSWGPPPCVMGLGIKAQGVLHRVWWGWGSMLIGPSTLKMTAVCDRVWAECSSGPPRQRWPPCVMGFGLNAHRALHAKGDRRVCRKAPPAARPPPTHQTYGQHAPMKLKDVLVKRYSRFSIAIIKSM